MARIRKFVAYRRLERPYTRTSKFKDKAFIRVSPNIKVVRFDIGNTNKQFSHTLRLVSMSDLQIRDNALESARQTSTRLLENSVGLPNFFMRLKPYPHHILRENPLAAGAGADRFSTGMQKAFGKPIGSAAQIRKGQSLMELSVNKEHLETAKKALSRASKKLPCHCTIDVRKN